MSSVALQNTPVKHTAFARGSIKFLRMRNFMIHSDAVIYPSCNTNFIIGLNGSGKSSIVCAMCLTLGGHPNYMKRQVTLGEFVKTGTKEAILDVRRRR